MVSLDAAAWGRDGHRAVAAIAEKLIAGSKAQERVAALLAPGESLETIANWPDCAKGNHCGAPTPEMVEYAMANPKHGQYHYTDIPFQNAHYRDGAVGSADDDIVQTLKRAIAVLQGKDAAASNPHRFTPRQALILVTHLLGDIHQPLHVGAAYVGRSGAFVVPSRPGQIDAVDIFDARGGNNLLLDDRPAASGANLHSYWDVTLVGYAMRHSGARTPQQFARSALAARPAPAANTGDPAGWPYQWADDALQASKLVHAGLAPGPVKLQTGRKGEMRQVWTLTLPPDYAVSSSALARVQLSKGGYRLAALLQAIWP